MDALRELFPEVFAEGKVDFEKLKQALGEFTDDSPERYGLSWAGKSEAKRAFQSLSSGTLAPMREQSVNFDTTENLIIEGDNLEVLKLLQKSYYGKVKMIYIDPPYNTGNEFIYPDNFREGLEDYLKYSGQVTDEGFKVSTNTETSGRFHSKWLDMMFPRLFLARNLLREDGLIFVSIDDHESHNLRLALNEIFGEENFVVSIAWKKATGANDIEFAYVHENVLLYRRSVDAGIGRLPRSEEQLKMYSNPDNDPRGDWASDNYVSKYTPEERPTLYYPIRNPHTGEEVCPKAGQTWRCSKETHKKNEEENRVWWGLKGELAVPRYKRFLSEVQEGVVPRSLWDNVGTNEHGRSEFIGLGFYRGDFDNPKPTALVKRALEIATRPNDGDIVLDFFAGSGTTAHAVLDMNRHDRGNRQFILVQLPEPIENQKFASIADICRERVRRVIKKLNDEDNGKLAMDEASKPDCGFRALRLTSSNFKLWNADTAPTDAEGLAEQLSLYADHLLPDRSQEDILYELLLKAGVSLGAKIAKVEVAGRTAFDVSEGLLLICLEDEVTEENLRAMVQRKPEQVLCLDNAFKGNDQLKTNTVLEMKSHDITFHTV